MLDELADGLPERGAALLVEAGRRAEEARTRVLRTTGVQSEAQLPFAGMHQLVLPVLDQADRLPGPQQTAFGDKATLVTGSCSGMGAATAKTLFSGALIATMRYKGAILDFVMLDALRDSHAAATAIHQTTAALHPALRTDWSAAMH